VSADRSSGLIESARSRDDTMDDYNRLLATLEHLDERGLVLTLAAFAEECLGALLSAFMLRNKAAEKLLEGFNAPLGTLSARIQASFALGLITDEQYGDLERLRRTRNEFAHSWRAISLDNQKLSMLIDGIAYCPYSPFPPTRKAKLQVSLSWLLLELRVNANQLVTNRRSVNVIGFHLVPGLSGPIDQQIAQINRELADIEDELADAVGNKREFLLLVRRNWVVRLGYVERAAPVERRADLIAIREELVRRLS